MSLETARYIGMAGFVCFLLTPFIIVFIKGFSAESSIVLTKYALSVSVMYFFIVAPFWNYRYQLDQVVESLDRNGDGSISPSEEATWTNEEKKAMDNWLADGAKKLFVYFVSPIIASIYSAFVFGIIHAVYWCCNLLKKRKRKLN